MKNTLKEMKKAVKAAGKKIVETVEKNRKMLAYVGLYATVQMNSVICYAEDKKDKNGVGKVTSGLDSLKTLVISIVVAAGGLYLAKNVMELAAAYQQSDTSGMNSAIKGIVGAAMMISVSGIIALFS